MDQEKQKEFVEFIESLRRRSSDETVLVADVLCDNLDILLFHVSVQKGLPRSQQFAVNAWICLRRGLLEHALRFLQHLPTPSELPPQLLDILCEALKSAGAELRRERRNHDALVRVYSFLGRAEPNVPSWAFLRGEAHAALGASHLAEAAFREAIQVDPTYDRAVDALASSYVARGRLGDALALNPVPDWVTELRDELLYTGQGTPPDYNDGYFRLCLDVLELGDSYSTWQLFEFLRRAECYAPNSVGDLSVIRSAVVECLDRLSTQEDLGEYVGLFQEIRLRGWQSPWMYPRYWKALHRQGRLQVSDFEAECSTMEKDSEEPFSECLSLVRRVAPARCGRVCHGRFRRCIKSAPRR